MALALTTLILLGVAAESHAQNTLIPLRTGRDLVFSYAGNYLYISTSKGSIERYNLSTGHIDRSYNLGGSLNGIDIARDDSFLLVAQNKIAGSQGKVQKLALATGTVTAIPYTRVSDEDGAWDVALDANGYALVTTTGQNWCWIRQLNLANNTFTLREDATEAHGAFQSVYHDVQLRRSADGTRIACYESSLSSRAIFIYNTATDKFFPYIQAENASASGASLNRDGTLLGTQLNTWISHHAAIDTVPALQFVNAFNGIDGDVVFDAVRNRVYGVNTSTDQIIAYSTDTSAEQFRLNIDQDLPGSWEQFGTGTLVASHDGRYLALETQSGIRLFTIPQSPPPPGPTPAPLLADRRDMVFDHSGNYLYVSTSTGFVIRYNLVTQSADRAYYLGGSLYGVDIAPNDSFLLACQDNIGVREAVVQKLDLASGGVSNLAFWRANAGSWDVAIGSKGQALLTVQLYGFGLTPFYQIDLAANRVNLLIEFPRFGHWASVGQNSALSRSADYRRLYLLSNDYPGAVFTYNAVTNTFETPIQTDRDVFPATGAVNRSGTLLATRFDGYIALDSALDLKLKHIFTGDGGIAFDAVTDTLYATLSSSDQLVAYDTNNLREKFRINIGEDLSAGVTQFGTGALVASHNGKRVALATPSGIKVFTVSPAPTSSDPPPADLTNPRGMVFDSAGRSLYIATGSGVVYPYDIASGQLGSPYAVGGSLNGIDITADDSFLIIAQSGAGLAEGVFHKLDLSSGAVTDIKYRRAPSELGGWDVAIAANGLAFVSEEYGAPYDGSIRQINPATNVITTRSDAPLTAPSMALRRTQIRRSADRSRLCFLEPEMASGPILTYDSLTNGFGPVIQTGLHFREASTAINRDGSLLAVRDYFTGLNTTSDFKMVHVFTTLDSGVAFDALEDVLYGVNSSSEQIIAYDTNTFTEKFRIRIGEPVGSRGSQFEAGTLIASQDGRYLALITPTTVRVLDVTARATPTPTPPSTSVPVIRLAASPMQVNEGGDAVFTISASTTSSQPITVSYSLRGKATLGTDYTLSGATGTVTIPPGQTSAAVTLHALSDGIVERQESAKIKLLKGAGYKLVKKSKKASVIILNAP